MDRLPPDPFVPSPRIAVVVAARDGRERVGRALAQLVALPEQPQLVVVDNGSRDGIPAFVHAHFPQVRVVAFDRDLGVAARNHGVAVVTAPYVAFAQDDSW